ncbi:NAD(P)-dependent alcohol dehydrogenase [bacterium RCC_150]
MKAIVQDKYGSFDVLDYADVDVPVPGEGEVLIRVHAAGVDPGVWHLMTGLPYLTRVIGFGLRKPKVRVRGVALAGRVEAVGAKVVGFRPGDEVYGTCEGSFAEYAVARVDKIALKPVNLDFEQAAAVPISAATALKALRDTGRLQTGQSVLVIGAGGGVGSFAVQLAKAFGALVTGVCSTSKVEHVRSMGADDVIDYTKEDFLGSSGRRSEADARAVGSAHYDLILDTGGNRPLYQLRRALTPTGTLVVVGGEGGGRFLGGFDRTLRAPLLSAFVGQKLRGLIAVESREDLQFLAGLIEAGKVVPAVDKAFSLDRAPEAIRYVHEGRARGKVVVTV